MGGNSFLQVPAAIPPGVASTTPLGSGLASASVFYKYLTPLGSFIHSRIGKDHNPCKIRSLKPVLGAINNSYFISDSIEGISSSLTAPHGHSTPEGSPICKSPHTYKHPTPAGSNFKTFKIAAGAGVFHPHLLHSGEVGKRSG